MNQNKHMEIWARDYGNKTNAIAECGCEVVKAAYGDENSNYGWNLDHIWPKNQKGSDVNENLQILCIGCNEYKSDDLEGELANGNKFKVTTNKRFWDGIIGTMHVYN